MLGRAAKTRAPQRILAPELLGQLAVPVESAGVVLGRDSAGRAVLVRLFGAQPVTVTFIGGWWAAQVLVLRCLAHGASVVVEAGTGSGGTLAGEEHWLGLNRFTGPDQVRRLAGDPAPSWPASADQPLLRLHDVGPSGPVGRAALQPWHTQLTVLSGLTPASLQTVAGADIVLAQRLEPAEAALVGSALLLGPEFVARFTAMDNEMVAAFRGPAVRYAWLNPTDQERQAFG